MHKCPCFYATAVAIVLVADQPLAGESPGTETRHCTEWVIKDNVGLRICSKRETIEPEDSWHVEYDIANFGESPVIVPRGSVHLCGIGQVALVDAAKRPVRQYPRIIPQIRPLYTNDFVVLSPQGIVSGTAELHAKREHEFRNNFWRPSGHCVFTEQTWFDVEQNLFGVVFDLRVSEGWLALVNDRGKWIDIEHAFGAPAFKGDIVSVPLYFRIQRLSRTKPDNGK